jgi:hypothetical protein
VVLDFDYQEGKQLWVNKHNKNLMPAWLKS